MSVNYETIPPTSYYSANTENIQICVKGWREITAGTGRLWVNDETKTAVFYFTRTGTVTSEISYADAIPSGYRPKSNVRMKAHNTQTVFLTVESAGNVKINGSASSSITVGGQITYAYGV